MQAFFLLKPRRNSGIFCKIFAGVWNKICVISTPRACSFGSERTIDSIKSFGDAIRFAQRTLAEKSQILCAWRAERFCNSFMNPLRKLCVISTPGASLLGSVRNFDFTKSFSHVTRFSQRTLAECTHFFCSRRAKIPEILKNFRKNLEQNLRHFGAARLIFRIYTHN